MDQMGDNGAVRRGRHFRRSVVGALLALVAIAGPVYAQKAGIESQALPPPPGTRTAPAVASGDIVIGLVAPMSGYLRRFGDSLQRGATQAIADINAAGGVLGRKLRLEIADDSCGLEVAAKLEAIQLAEKNAVAVIGHFCTESSLAAAEIYAGRSVLQIVPFDGDAALTERQPAFRHLFRLAGRDDREGGLAIHHLAASLGGRRLALLRDGSSYGEALAAGVIARLRGLGAAPVLDAAAPDATADVTDTILQLRAAAPDILYYAGADPAAAAVLVREMRERGLTALFVGGEIVATRQFRALAGAAAEGSLATKSPDPAASPAGRAVAEKLGAAGAPPNSAMLTGYAAVQVFAQAARQANAVALENLARAMRRGKFTTALGTLQFDDKGDLRQSPHRVFVWQGNELKPATGGAATAATSPAATASTAQPAQAQSAPAPAAATSAPAQAPAVAPAQAAPSASAAAAAAAAPPAASAPSRAAEGSPAPSGTVATRPPPPPEDMRAKPGRDGWAVDARTGCWVWNEQPQPGETVTWSGPCGADGKATGRGVTEWRRGDKKGRFEGERREGRAHGEGVAVFYSGAKYSGQWRDNRRHGRGIAVYADGARYDGEWKNDNWYGRGVLTYADGTQYDGQWNDGKRHGRGAMTFKDGSKYDGEWKDDDFDGHGKVTYPEGGSYEGTWQAGERHGRGVMTYKDGAKYDGDWLNDRRFGHGVLITAKGGRYEGQWKGDKFDGRGVATYADGARYEGQWQADKRHGRGVMTYKDGAKYDGEWNADRRHGHGIQTDVHGAKYDVEWKDGKPHGRGLYTLPNGERYDGEFKDGKRHGKGVARVSDGDYYDGNWRDDYPDGFGEATINGRFYRGMWFGGCFREGTWDRIRKASWGKALYECPG